MNSSGSPAIAASLEQLQRRADNILSNLEMISDLSSYEGSFRSALPKMTEDFGIKIGRIRSAIDTFVEAGSEHARLLTAVQEQKDVLSIDEKRLQEQGERLQTVERELLEGRKCLTEIRSQKETLEAKVVLLRGETEALKEAVGKEVQELREAANKDIADQKVELDNRENGLDAREEELETARQRLQRRNEQLGLDKKRVQKQFRSEKEAADKEIAEAKENIARRQMQLAENEQAVQRRQDSIEEKNRDVLQKEATLEKWSDAISACEHRLRYAATQMNGSQQTVDSEEFFAMLEQSCDRMVDKLATAETTSISAKQRADGLAEELRKERDVNSGYWNRVSDLQKEIDRLKEKISSLNKELGRLRGCEARLQRLSEEKADVVAETAKINQDNMKLQGDVFTLTGEVADLRRELRQRERMSESNVSELTRTLSHTSRRLEHAVASIEVKENLLKESRSECGRLHELYIKESQSVGDFEGKLFRTEQDLQKSISSAVALQKTIQEQQSRVRETEKDSWEFSAKQQHAQEALDAHKLELDRMCTSNASYMEELGKIKSMLTIKDAENACLRRDLDAEKNGNQTDSLRNELHRTLELLENEKANNITESLRRHVQRLEDELTAEKAANKTKSMEKELAVLRRELKSENDRTDDLLQQVEQLQLNLDKKTDTTKDLRRQQMECQLKANMTAESLESELTNLRNQLETQLNNDRTVDLRQQVDELQIELEKKTAANRELYKQQGERDLTVQQQTDRIHCLGNGLNKLRLELESYVKNDRTADLRREVERLQEDLARETNANEQLRNELQTSKRIQEERRDVPGMNKTSATESFMAGADADHRSTPTSTNSSLAASRVRHSTRGKDRRAPDVFEGQTALRQRIGDKSPQRSKSIRRAALQEILGHRP